VAFAQADAADEDHVGFILHELEAKKILNLSAVDFAGPVEVELLQKFYDREASLLDTPLGGAILPRLRFTVNELGEEVQMRPLALPGLTGQFLEVFLNEQ
jgi:hypothetical protein